MTKKQRLLLYGICILLFLFGFDLINTLSQGNRVEWNKFFSFYHITTLVYMTATFWLSYKLWNLVWQKRKWLQITGVVVLLYVFFIIFRYLLEEVISPLLIGHGNYFTGVTFQYYVSDNLYYASIYIVVGFLLFLLDHQIRLQKEKAAMEVITRNAELDFLRLQVSPHFLFNALNSIYALAYKKAEETPEAILQLSNLMRYVLYEKNAMVDLDQEWDMLQDFISLQAIRLNEPLQLATEKSGGINGFQIPPYLLIAFVENAFKHGILTHKDDPYKLSLSAENDHIRFISENMIGKKNKDHQKGIGLDNIRKRLDLLYPDKHRLVINHTATHFSVDLTIHS